MAREVHEDTGSAGIDSVGGSLIAKEDEQAVFAGLFRNNPVPMAITAVSDRRSLEVNDAFIGSFGYARSEIIGKTGVEIGLYPHPEEVAAVAGQLRAMDRISGMDGQIRGKDGKVRDVLISGEVITSREQKYFLLVAVDVTLRMQAEAELEQFRASFENGVVPQGLASTDGRLLRVNDAMAKMLGFTRAEIEGKPFNQFTHPDDRVAGTRTVREMLSGRESARFEKRYVARNGATVWVDVNVTAICAADGTAKYFFGTYLDITKRKRVEEELQESRRRLRLALDSAGMGVWRWDVVANRRYFEDQTCAMLGLNPANFRGTLEEFLGAVHPDDRDTLKAVLARTLEQDAPYECEYTAIWPDGSKHSIATRGRLLRDGEGKPLRIDGILWDQTERVRASQALRESEERFRQLASVFPQTIFEADLTGRFTYLNEGGFRMNGVTHADLEKGIEVMEFVAPEDRQRVMEDMRKCVETMSGGYTENRAVRKDGTRFDTLVYAAPILSQGQIKGLRGIVLDISERKQAERRLQEANRLLESATARANEMAVQAELASKAKSTFLANMSHEIRTPMNGLIGITGLLLDTDLTAEQRRFVETLRASSDSLVFLINDILDLSKIEAGKVTLEVIDFDLGKLFGNLATLMAPRAAEKHLEFTCTLAPTVPVRLRGDPGRLRQVLTNLVSNAFKFTKAGKVGVTAEVEQESPHEAVLRFSVRDTGIGIASDKIGLLFNKFVQTDDSITRRFGGTGLGLAISKQLAELMGGKIGVCSEENRGSEFWFTARFGKQASVKSASESSPKARPAGPTRPDVGRENFRILLAEDNLTNQMVAVGILKKLGFQVDVVADGRKAVEALRTTPYDLVLMDVQMPEMDGLEATRMVRAAGSESLNHAVPIIAMTAHAMEGARSTCLDAGMNDYIAKPILPAALSAVLEKWLAKPTDRGV
jgi:PAS domain S-box-containing protein